MELCAYKSNSAMTTTSTNTHPTVDAPMSVDESEGFVWDALELLDRLDSWLRKV